MTDRAAGARLPVPAGRGRPGAAGFWLGGALGLGATGLGFLLLLHLVTLAFASADALLPADGERHTLTLPADQDRMLFTRPGEPVPDCLVGPPGEPGTAPRPIGLRVRTSGEGGDWVAFGRFATGGGQVAITCTAQVGVEVRVGRPVGFHDVFGLLGWRIVAPALLGLAALVLVVVTGLRRSAPPPSLS